MMKNSDLALFAPNDAPWYWRDHTGRHWELEAHGIPWQRLFASTLATGIFLVRLTRNAVAGKKQSKKSEH